MKYLSFTINRYLCSDNSEVRFSQCNAGQGAEGKKLESFLQSYFGENVKITLYETKVTFFAGFTLRI